MNPPLKHMDAKGFARYLEASASQQRKIIASHKYADLDEIKTSVIYYMEARDRVAAYHQSKQSPQWLLEEASHLENLARYSIGIPRVRMENNARALREYHQYFAQRTFDLMNDIMALKLQYEDVVITSHPSLHIQEKGKEKLLKFDFTKGDISDGMIKTMTALMAEAAQKANLSIDPKNILYLDISQGKEFKGAKMIPTLLREIKATCANISAIWDSLPSTPSTPEIPDESKSSLSG